MMLLCLIASEETYGYEIVSKFNCLAGNIFGYTRDGTIYPILYRLEDNKLIKSRQAPATANGGMKKYYSVTDTGRQYLEEMKQYWEHYSFCVNQFINMGEEE